MRKYLLLLLPLLPCLVSAQGVIGIYTITPGSIAPGGGGGGGTPGGVDGDWQINSAGTFGGISPTAGWNNVFVSPTSALFAAWITDETGTAGNLVFSGSPTIASPTLTGTTTVSTANVTTVNVSTLQPTTNDGAALGSTSKQFSDLFLAEGAVINWDNGDATITQTSNDITVAGITTFGVGTSTAVTLGTIEVGAATDTTISRNAAGVIQVETNVVSMVLPRITALTSSATPTYNTDTCDVVNITALATAITSMTSSRTGTLGNFQQVEFRIKDDGTARAITWGADFSSGIATLPTTTILGKTLYVYCEFDTVTGDLMCQATGSYP